MPPKTRTEGDPVEPVAGAAPEAGTAKPAAKEVTDRVYVKDSRTLDLSHFQTQEKLNDLVLADAQAKHKGKKVEVRLLQVKHVIGQGFEIEYKAEVS